MSRTANARRMPYRLRVDRLDDRINPAPAVALSGNTLIAFDTDFPTTGTSTPVVGLGAGENLVGIDVRPQTGGLYGLTSNGAGAVRLYAISRPTGQATPLTAAPVRFDDGNGNPVNITGTNFGIDFNPTVDRLRVVTDTGMNFRLNPNTGGLIDGDNGGSTAVAGLNPDGMASGGTTKVDATAYTNNAPNATATTQYTLDAGTGKLFIQTPPNAGPQTSGVQVTLNGSNLAFTAANGFDIPAGVTVAKSNDPVTVGSGLAALTVGGSTGLYAIDLATGKATFRGTVGDGKAGVQGLAVLPTGATPFLGLAGGSLIRFSSAAPGTPVVVPIAGVGANETLVGIDLRPQTGQLYGLGVNADANTATLYLIDPQTKDAAGAATAKATAVGTAGSIAFVDAAGKAVDLPAASAGYGIDFNPSVDKLRVITGTGLNFRVNPLTGGPLDGDLGNTAAPPAGTNTDGTLNGGGTGSTASATAYTNSFGQSTGTGGATTQYTLDAGTDKLFIQNPPNAGTLASPLGVTLDGKALDFDVVNGFDIPAAVTVSKGNTAVASGVGFAGLTVGGKSGLYRIDLATGAATLLGVSGDGTVPLTGLTAGDVAANPSNPLLVGGVGFSAGSDAGAAAAAGIFRADKSTQVSVTAANLGTGTSGARVATADFNGDGVPDIVVGSGPGQASVLTVFDGRDGSTKLFTTAPFEASFTGGVFVAAGDVTGDGTPDVVVSPDQGGGPRIDAYSGVGFGKFASYFAFQDDPNFRGGARAAVGDLNNDGFGEVVVSAGFGGGPRVATFNGRAVAAGGANPDRLFATDFFVFENTLRNGAFVAVGDVDGDGTADIIAGGGPGGGPRVTVFSGLDRGVTLANFFAGDTSNRGGIRVAARNLDGDAKADIVVGNGPGLVNGVAAYAGSSLTPTGGTPTPLFSFDALAAGGNTGVFVG